MFTKITLTITAIILMIAFAGCNPKETATPASGETTPQNETSGSNTGSGQPTQQQMLPLISGRVASIYLDASADGTTKQLNQGEVMLITLESNPSTGYSWFATIADQKVLMQMGEAQYQESPASSGTPVVGAPGTETMYFQAVDQGTTTLTLNYQRSWETNVAPEKTITITVEVQ